MAAATGQISGLGVEIYFKSGSSLTTLSTTPVYSDVVGSGKLIDATSATTLAVNRVEQADALGEPSQTLNEITSNGFGAHNNSKTFPLSPDQDSFTLTLNVDYSDTVHAAIVAADIDDDYEMAWYVDATKGETVIYFRGKIGAKYPTATRDGIMQYVVNLTQTQQHLVLSSA